ncbi:MAG: DNA-processing protein DprA [bacterium]
MPAPHDLPDAAEVATLAGLGAVAVASIPGFSLPSGWLRVMGSLPPAPGLAIVGARGADPYGLELAGRIARAAVERGVWVISGGAFGVDAAAHEAALATGGSTVAVLGAGLDRPAPASHRGLFRRILDAGGGVASPFPCGQGAARWTFPRRNPWIAGLARAVVVVQAGLGSGTLHTARAALASQTPVFVVPGPFDSPLHAGCHALVAEGARLLTAVDGWCDEARPAERVARSPAFGQALWRACATEARPLAELAAAAGLTAGEAMAQATALELAGWLRSAPGGRYARAQPEEA